jgi:uncharacterized protein YndB with AHSA1/START domain
MATVSKTIQASPAEVFSVLSNGWLYSNWVVGTSHMRAVDAHWPAAGSKLHHASGVWPLVARDETTVQEVLTDARLVLTAKGRPFGEARVVLELAPVAGGTLVTMIETPVAGPAKWLHNPVAEAVLVRRNVESLDRLAAVAERRTDPSE